VVCVHICYTPHVCTLRDRCKSNYASYTVRLKVNVGFWRWWRLAPGWRETHPHDRYRGRRGWRRWCDRFGQYGIKVSVWGSALGPSKKLQQSDSKTAMPVASTSCGERRSRCWPCTKGSGAGHAEHAHPRAGRWRHHDLLGSCAAHAQQGGCQATSLHVGTGTARPRRHFVVAAPRVQPSGS
jgi:hypothetical protein